jgi:Holliday junction resolvase RusA-like endonuclease
VAVLSARSDEPACRFSVPICPSTNNLYLGRRWKTAEYTNWANDAGWLVKAQRPVPLKGRLRVLIEAPLARNRDIENLKPIMDLATNLGLIEDDRMIDDLRIVRTSPPGGEIRVSIWPM